MKFCFKMWLEDSKGGSMLRYLSVCLFIVISSLGGIAPNQVIARSEFEVHRQIVTE